MKIRLSRKTIAKSLLSFVGVQVLTVAAGLSQKYLFNSKKIHHREELNTTPDYYQIPSYSAIDPERNLLEQANEPDKSLHIYLVGTTTGATISTSTASFSSGDNTNLDSAMDFLV